MLGISQHFTVGLELLANTAFLRNGEIEHKYYVLKLLKSRLSG